MCSCSKYYSDIYVNNNDNNNDTKNSFIFVRGTRPYIQNASPLFNCQLFRICVFDVWFNNQSMFAIIWALKKIIINFFFCSLVEWPYFLICSCISWVTLMYPALIYFFLWVLQLLNKKISTTDNHQNSSICFCVLILFFYSFDCVHILSKLIIKLHQVKEFFSFRNIFDWFLCYNTGSGI